MATACVRHRRSSHRSGSRAALPRARRPPVPGHPDISGDLCPPTTTGNPGDVPSALVSAGEAADPLDLRELPLLVAKRAHVPRLQPALDAVQVEHVTAASCGTRRRVSSCRGRWRARMPAGAGREGVRTPGYAQTSVVGVVDDALARLVLDRGLVQVVAADGARVRDEVPRPDRHDVPLLHPADAETGTKSERLHEMRGARSGRRPKAKRRKGAGGGGGDAADDGRARNALDALGHRRSPLSRRSTFGRRLSNGVSHVVSL